MLEMLQAPMTRVDAGVSQLLNRVDEKERIEMLEWISVVPFGQHHDTISENRTPGTGDWLVEHESFNRWKEGDSTAFFWLQGNPGSGKTYLTSKVIDTIQHRISHPPKNEGFAFFYCKRFEKPRRDEPLTILQSFVRQLSTTARNPESMRTQLQEICKEAREKGTDLRLEQCKQQILASLDVYHRTTLVIDAMDECDPESRHVLVNSLKLFLESKKPVRIFISSRPDRELELALDTSPDVEIQASDNQEDIKKYIEVELTRLLDGKPLIKPMKPEIIPTLLERSQGMFQWVSLQVKRVGTSRTRGEAKWRLNDLPPGLDEAYDYIWREIEAQEEPSQTLTKRALQWAMAASKHLTTTEILAAIRLDVNGDLLPMDELVDEQGLLSLCSNFLVIDSRLQEWQFPHLSVREYLGKKENWSISHAHYYAASSCLSYFVTNYKTDGKELDAQLEAELEIETEMPGATKSPEKPAQSDDGLHTLHPFHIYMRQCWPQHLNGAKDIEMAKLSPLLKTFLGSPDESTVQYQRWYQKADRDLGLYARPRPKHYMAHNKLHNLVPADAAIFAMCCFSLDSIVGDWWENEAIDISRVNHYKINLLEIAAEEGSLSVCEKLIQMLVDQGTDTNTQGQFLDKALVAASQGGQEEVVQMLLDRGAELNAEAKVHNVFGNALQRAASCGHVRVVQMLLDRGIDVNSENDKEGNALRSAALIGHDKVVTLLLDRGAHDNHEGGWFPSAILAATVGDQPKVRQMLVDRGFGE
jgi:hypothetical protein